MKDETSSSDVGKSRSLVKVKVKLLSIRPLMIAFSFIVCLSTFHLIIALLYPNTGFFANFFLMEFRFIMGVLVLYSTQK